MAKKLQKKKSIEIAKFLIRLNILLIPFYLIAYFNLSVSQFQNGFALLISKILNIIGYENTVSDFIIYIQNKLVIDISFDCIGWKSMYSLFALVFAVREKLKKKLKFLIKWVPVVFILNIFRVIFNIIVGIKFGIKWMNIFHSILWQGGMIAIVLVIWYIWIKQTKLNTK